MRVVVDTNIFVSSFFGGKPKKIIDLWASGKITLCLSNKIVDEYFDVLSRMGLKKGKEFSDLLKLFQTGMNSFFTSKTKTITVCRDPDDNKFIETALALSSQYIISGDKDLTELKRYMSIKIVTPSEFLEILST